MLDLSQIAAIAAEIRAELGEDDDEAAVADTLDGATDAMGLMDWLIAKQQEAAALAMAARAQKVALAAREARLEARADAMKARMGQLLDAMTLSKVERPGATVSRTKPRQSVEITDESSIPTQLCRIKREPDKTAIKKLLEQGDAIPGARLATGDAGVMVRVG